ncbi:MAG: Ig-like domain-containing protein [Gemmatimonas sp.]
MRIPHRTPQAVANGQWRALLTTCAVCAVAACSGGGTDVTPVCTVSAITVGAAATTITVGQSTQASANYTAQNCSPAPTLSWSSDNAAVASVASDGRITGVTPGGPVTIRAATNGRSGTVAITVIQVPVATVALAPTTATLIVGQTTTLVATARDAAGGVLTGRTVTWGSSNNATATVAAGVVTSVAPGGPVTITATVEGISATAAITVNAPVYLAYGLAGVATPAAPYAATEAFTGAGDAPTVAKVATGSYEVTIPGMAAGNPSQRFAYVNARATFAQCHPNGNPTNVGNGALLLKVICGSVNTGAAVDAPFSFVAFGRGVFTGRTGFLVTPQAAIAASPFSPTSPFTYTSRGTDADVTVEGTGSPGRYTIKFLALGRQGTDNPENHFSQSWGTTAGTWCADGGWSLSVFSATVYCYGPTGAAVDERFGTLVIDAGRAGKRFAVSWMYDPVTPANPVGSYTYSTGGAISIARLGLGSYDVTFAGLGGAASVPVSAIVSSYGGSANNNHCTAIQITRAGADLVVRVACVTAGAALNVDQVFTIAIIE